MSAARYAGDEMMRTLTPVERLKFEILNGGISMSQGADAYLSATTNGADRTPADYASTSGLILLLDGSVWVNAPIHEHNPNFIDAPEILLDVEAGHLIVRCRDLVVPTRFWIPPSYHGSDMAGDPANRYVFTHGDRARLSPIQGCAMTCKFCNIPYQDRYATKPVAPMVEALRIALNDAIQPARHILISGGTPRASDVAYLREVYRTVLTEFADTPVDIMMVPVPGLLDWIELDDLGVHQVSINLEIANSNVARELMPNKHRAGADTYLDAIEAASAVLGQHRVRSMLMVGLEEPEATITGVTAILERGGTPVLSPFRPDPSTPLAASAPPSVTMLEEVFLEAEGLAQRAGIELGPDCPPCTHNTLTLPALQGSRVGEPTLAMA